jgi:glycosyltransferase involved in cell wall biosynthesis
VRLLLVNQFYPPDVAPTGQLLEDLARALALRGHAVDVLCSRRAYAGGASHPAFEERGGIRVHRVAAPLADPRSLPGRVADQVAFLALAGRRALTLPRPDLVLALTTPPFVGALAKVLARWRGAAHAHWVMDVYPDVLAAHGLLRGGSLVYRTLGRLARWQLAGAASVIALGPCMAGRLARYAERPAEWVALWGEDAGGDAAEFEELRRERGWRPGETVLMYSGHMGLAHRIGEFLEAARRLDAAGPRWVFAGAGPRRHAVEAFAATHPEARVELLPYVPRERLRASLAAADVHLMSLASGWQGLVAPSKVQAAFGVGRPVLYVGPPDNEAAAWLAESGGGWIVAEDDAEGLLRAVAQACDPGERAVRGERAERFAREHFDRARNCGRIVELLEAGARDRGTAWPG